MTFKWTDEAKARVAELLAQGKSASAIGKSLGVTRNAIVGIVHRDAGLKYLGLAGYGERGRAPKLTQEQITERKRQHERSRRERMRQYQKAYAAQKRGIVIPFPEPTRKLPANSPRLAGPRPNPVMSVVSNNVPLMVQDWLAKNGGARKFGERETTQSWEMRSFLADRGVTVGFVRGSDKWNLSRDGGRPRIVKWADIMRLVDEIRIAEGLPPFSVSAPRRKQGAVA